jgi:hypothetical protein
MAHEICLKRDKNCFNYYFRWSGKFNLQTSRAALTDLSVYGSIRVLQMTAVISSEELKIHAKPFFLKWPFCVTLHSLALAMMRNEPFIGDVNRALREMRMSERPLIYVHVHNEIAFHSS